MTRPIIGITTSTTTIKSSAFAGATLEYFSMHVEYCLGVERAGGLPVLLPNVGDASVAKEAAEKIDGLMLTGGMDVNPLLFGEEPIKEMGAIDVMRDVFELEIAKTALERGIPVFGICRGTQVLALAAGGSIVQDVHAQANATLKHSQRATGKVATHSVEIKPNSRLAKILGKTKTAVNSYHHQAAASLPEGYAVSATAPDGVIEGIEKEGEQFALGVQWHPELLLDEGPDSPALFKAFVKESQKSSGRRSKVDKE